MHILLRFLVVAVIAFLAGSTITPLLWQPVLVKQSQDILPPYAVFSFAVVVASLGYAVGQWRKPPRR